jgi:Fe-S cluster assembly protein SufB
VSSVEALGDLGPADRYELGWRDCLDYADGTGTGLSEATIRRISAAKGERAEVLQRRLQALEAFEELPTPAWVGPSLVGLDLSEIHYYARPIEHRVDDWAALPPVMRATFDRLGVPEAERFQLEGLCAQYDSEVVYERTRAELDPLGVVFCDMDTAVREHWDLIEPYLGSVVPPGSGKFAALNAAVWSGGTFLYVPAGVHVERPLQTYFRVNAERLGQFEHTLIVVEDGGFAHYVDACSATTYESASLHVGVVEVIAAENSRCRVSGVQYWPKNVFNIATKQAVARRGARVEWIDANLGARATLTHPGVILEGEGAHGSVLSIGYAASGQHQDSGARMMHLAPRTTSTVTSKSIARDGGRSDYRGVIHMAPEAEASRSFVRCDSLILDDASRSDTYPSIEMEAGTSRVGHEASVSRLDDARLFYLMSRGLTEQEATALLVAGFVEPISRELPLDCAREVNRLIALDMEAAGAVG